MQQSCCRSENIISSQGTFFEFIAQLAEALPLQLNQCQQTDEYSAVSMQSLLKYIATYYSEPITIADALEVSGLRRSQFHVAFRQTTGLSFVHYLTKVRIGEACHLLRHTSNDILNIAYSCGFGSPSQFFKAFKKETKTTPDSYRKKR